MVHWNERGMESGAKGRGMGITINKPDLSYICVLSLYVVFQVSAGSVLSFH